MAPTGAASSPAPGKLFVVGDPKQSIYRFRRADIAIYDEVKRELLADGLRRDHSELPLGAGLIAWVNGVFDRAAGRAGGGAAANVRLAAQQLARLPDPIARRSWSSAAIDEGMHADEIREYESRRRRRAAPRRRSETRPWPVRDQASGELRPAHLARRGDPAPGAHRARAPTRRRSRRRRPLPPRGQPGLLPPPGGARPDLAPARDRRPDRPPQRVRRRCAQRCSAAPTTTSSIHRATGGTLGLPPRRRERAREPVADALAMLRDLHRAPRPLHASPSSYKQVVEREPAGRVRA